MDNQMIFGVIVTLPRGLLVGFERECLKVTWYGWYWMVESLLSIGLKLKI